MQNRVIKNLTNYSMKYTQVWLQTCTIFNNTIEWLMNSNEKIYKGNTFLRNVLHIHIHPKRLNFINVKKTILQNLIEHISKVSDRSNRNINTTP